MKSALLSVFFVASAFVAMAQQYLSRNFGTQDGLPHANVYEIYQDKRGYIWFCTDFGVAYYDGQKFHSAFPDSSNLLSNTVTSIWEGDDGVMYFNSYKNGLLTLTDTVVRPYRFKKGGYPPFSLRVIKEQNTIWILGKPWLYYIKDGVATRYRLQNSNGKDVRFIQLRKNTDGLFACSSNGLYRIEGDTLKTVPANVSGDTVVDIAQNRGALWIANKHSIRHIVNGQQDHEYKLDGRLVKTIMADNNGDLWIALEGDGTYLISGGKMQDISALLPVNKTVVNSMLQDRSGNIWLGTYGAGVSMISSTGIRGYNPEHSDRNMYCKALCDLGNGKMLIGSKNKIYVWENGKIVSSPFRTLKAGEFIYFIEKVNARIYIGTDRELIMMGVDGRGEHTVPYNGAHAAISMFRERDGRILVGDYTKLLELKDERLVISSLCNNTAHRYNAIHRRTNGDIWVGTANGLKIWTHGFDTPKTWYPNLNINAIVEDAENTMWVATDNGLLRFAEGKFSLIKKADGLSSDKCNTLYAENNRRLWIGTLMGLNYVNINTGQIHAYNKGLFNDDVLALCLMDEKLFAGTVNKLVSIAMSDIGTESPPLPLYITQVKTVNLLINDPHTLSVKYTDNHVTISFIALEYRLPALIEYSYKIEGLDNSWHSTGNTSVTVPALPSGNYRFVLRARRAGEAWTKELTLPITVATPFQRTWWFITFSILLILGLVVWLARRQAVSQHAKKREKLTLQNKMAYLKQQALSALINPHFMFNCLNSIQYYLDSNENDKANSYLADFARLLRATMEDAQKVEIDLHHEIERLQLYLSLEQLRFSDMEYSIEADDDIDLHHTYIPNMILQPYVENAIWHGMMPGRKGRIKITVTKHGANEIMISIVDNGPGINSGGSEPKRESHYGMKLTEERLKLLGQLSNERHQVHAGEITNIDGECIGTQIIVIVPARTESQHRPGVAERENAERAT